MCQSTRPPLEDWVTDARICSLRLIDDLDDDQLMGPRMGIINPLLWEIGHVAWFQENWVLRHALGRAPLRADADALYDSTAVGHDSRWDLPLARRKETVQYAIDVRDRVLEALKEDDGQRVDYFVRLSVFHEDMHTEAFTYTRQTLSYPPPRFIAEAQAVGRTNRDDRPSESSCRGDASISGGEFWLGAVPGDDFVFDNEKWAHPVQVAPFRMARTAVTQAEFAAFVDEGGYLRRELWSDAGWKWRAAADVRHPIYWRSEGGAWQRRVFHRWIPLEPNRPAVHVNYYEADAYCRWAGRRLPTEAEWELAAAGTPDDGHRISKIKRRFPWGDAEPSPAMANLDWQAGHTVDVAALPSGDSAFGCRQMIGNVWEWTASDFQPYPGFEADPYREYSQPWFGTHKVLRGGCWATRARLIRNTWRNFYTPDRRDVWAGFRTCARES